MCVCMCDCSIQEERQERRKVKQQAGIYPSDDSRRSRFEPPDEPVAGGISLGLTPGSLSFIACVLSALSYCVWIQKAQNYLVANMRSLKVLFFQRLCIEPWAVHDYVDFTRGGGFISADEYKGSITYSDDTSTTNIYLGNINPQVGTHSHCKVVEFPPLTYM